MTKLCEIVAVVRDRKKAGQDALTRTNKIMQASGVFDGHTRVYHPSEEEGEKLPPEHKEAAHSVEKLFAQLMDPLTQALDTTLMQDIGNTLARGTIQVKSEDEQIELEIKDVPVTYLLYLEKLATDVLTLLGNVPTYDPTVQWSETGRSGVLRSPEQSKYRTEKRPRAFVKYEATTEHPAQVEILPETVTIGRWDETKLTGAVSPDQKQQMIERANRFRDAIRIAREQANAQQLEGQRRIGRDVLRFLFAG